MKLFRVRFHLNVPERKHFNDGKSMNLNQPAKLQMYVLRCSIEVGSSTVHMGISNTNTKVARLSYPANKKLTFEPKGPLDRDTVFLLLWLHKQLGRAICMYIYIYINCVKNKCIDVSYLIIHLYIYIYILYTYICM